MIPETTHEISKPKQFDIPIEISHAFLIAEDELDMTAFRFEFPYWLLQMYPDHFRMKKTDFTRNRKISIKLLTTYLLCDTKKSMYSESNLFFDRVSLWTRLGSDDEDAEGIKKYMEKFKSQKCELPPKPGDSQYLEDKDSISKSALSQARNKLDPDGLYWMNVVTESQFYKQFESKLKKSSFMPDFFQLGIDGSDFVVPNTPELAACFGRYNNGKTGAMPVLGKSSWISDLQNQILLDCQINRNKYSERAMAKDHIETLNKYYPEMKAILEFDRGYFSFELMHLLYLDQNRRFLFRLAGNHLKEFQNQLKPGEEKVFTFQLKREQTNEYRNNRNLRNNMLSMTYTIRIAKPIIGTNPDGSPKHLVIATNIRPEEASLSELADAYWDRWNAETNYDYLKNDLMMEQFSGKNLQKILQEIYAAWMIFNMTTAVAIEAKLRMPIEGKQSEEIAQDSENQDDHNGKKKDPKKYKHEMEINYSVAFGKCKDTLLKSCCVTDPKLRRGLQKKLMIDIRRELVPVRLGRSFRRDRNPTRKAGPRTSRHI